MSNGCICCTLREDLLAEVTRLAKEERFDSLLIESTGISEPMPVAATFSFRDESGFSLADVARLDTMVTIVDAVNFLREDCSTQDLRQRGIALGPDDTRTLVDLLVDRVEFADVLVLSIVASSAVLDTGLFDEAKASLRGWARELEGLHTPETEEYGISSFVFRAWRPFHPERLNAFLNSAWPGVLRSKGFFWLAMRMAEVGTWLQAGPACRTGRAGLWWAAVKRDEWPTESESRAAIQKHWREPVRGQPPRPGDDRYRNGRKSIASGAERVPADGGTVGAMSGVRRAWPTQRRS